MCLELLSHCRDSRSKSSQCCHHSSFSGIMMSQSENVTRGPQRQAIQYHAWGSRLWDLGVTEDQGTQMKVEAKRLMIKYYFLQSHFRPQRQFYNSSLTKSDCCFSYESLALQDCNNNACTWWQASNSTSTMLGYRSMMGGNAELVHKASAVR